jgi:hypothetical protein
VGAVIGALRGHDSTERDGQDFGSREALPVLYGDDREGDDAYQRKCRLLDEEHEMLRPVADHAQLESKSIARRTLLEVSEANLDNECLLREPWVDQLDLE